MSDGYEPVRRGLRFIEAHLADPIGLEQIARAACLSPWHFHRLFAGVVGQPPIAYLRRRRLSEAARLLLEGNGENVLAVGLAAGFESQAAFARAFRKHYGIPPSRFRRELDFSPGLIYAPLDPTSIGPKEDVMEHKIVERPAFTVVGLSRDYTPATMPQIPQLWTEFAPQMGTLPGRKDDTCYGLCIPHEEAGGDVPHFTYASCVEVEADAPVPEGMARHDVPAARYAVFTFEGHISRFSEWVGKVFGEYFPATGLPRADAPELEFYDERFDGRTGNGQVDFYIPVELM